MIELLKKISWQEKVVMILALKLEHNYTIREVATELNTSPSKVHRDLYLADGLKIYPQIKDMEKANDAYKFLKRKKFRRPDGE